MTYDQTEKRMIAAHQLGLRDARAGHAETHPIRPYETYELESYQAGYRQELKRIKQRKESSNGNS